MTEQFLNLSKVVYRSLLAQSPALGPPTLVPWNGIVKALDELKSPLEDVRAKAKRSSVPDLKKCQRAYTNACDHASLKKAVRWLTQKGRGWRFITVDTFMNASQKLFDVIIDDLSKALDEGRISSCCFCIDSPWKSSFWMCCLFFNHLKMNRKDTSLYCNAHQCIKLMIESDDLTINKVCMTELAANTSLVFLDDACYSGRQLAEYVALVTSIFRKHMTGTTMEHMVAATYASDTALRLMRHLQHVRPVHVETFKGILHSRDIKSVIEEDVMLMPLSIMKDERGESTPRMYSFFFDFLKLESFHTTTIFEHKIPDAVSVPSMWLHIGLVPSRYDYGMYKIRDGKSSSLLQQARLQLLKPDPSHKDYARTVTSILSRDKSCLAKVTEAEVTPAKRMTLYLRPILPISLCDEHYARRYYELTLICDNILAAYGSYAAEIVLKKLSEKHTRLPECFVPAYKNTVFQTTIQQLKISTQA